MKKPALHSQILIALLLGALAGWLGGTDATLFGIHYFAMYDFIGTL